MGPGEVDEDAPRMTAAQVAAMLTDEPLAAVPLNCQSLMTVGPSGDLRRTL